MGFNGHFIGFQESSGAFNGCSLGSQRVFLGISWTFYRFQGHSSRFQEALWRSNGIPASFSRTQVVSWVFQPRGLRGFEGISSWIEI